MAIIGYPCLNSHSLQGHSHRNYRRHTTQSEDGPEWPTPVPVGEGVQENESEEMLATGYGVLAGVARDGFADDESSAEEALLGESSEDNTSPYPDLTAPNVSVTTEDEDWPEFLAKVHWTIWLACTGGFALGVALTIGLGFTFYICYCKQPEDPNELVSAGEDFQLVEQPVDHRPTIRDPPPSYSSLFSSRYHKVLPTAPKFTNHSRR